MATADEIRRLKAELEQLKRQFGDIDKIELVGKTPVAQARELTEQIVEYKRQLDSIEDSWGTVSGIIEDIKNEFGKATDGFKQAANSFNRIQSISKRFQEDALGLQKMSSKEIKGQIQSIKKEVVIQQKSLELLEQKVKNGETLTENEEKMVAQLKSENIQNEIALKTAAKRLAEEKKIVATLGIAGNAMKGLEGALSKIGFNTDFFEDVNNNMRETAESAVKQNKAFGRTRVLLTGIGGALKGIAENLTDPIVVVGGLFKGLKALYNLTGKFITQNKQALLATSGAFGKTQIKNMESVYGLFEELSAAANSLRTELGFVPNMNKKILESVHLLTHGFGLSGSEAANLFKVSSELGVELKDMPATIAGMGGEVEASTGHAVDFQKAMQALGGASSSIRFNMKGSANELIKAANFAALLGMSMDDIRGAAESTLDFESSIQKEMEAELFLNKQLNLDRYRYAALTGDAATQAEELQRLIAENGPELKNNTLAQEKFSQALGISREQLTASIEQMELQKELGFESADAQAGINALMKQGYTKQQALNKLRSEGAEGVTNAIKAEEAFQNRFKLAQRKFQEAFTALADRVFSPENMKKIDKMIQSFSEFMTGPMMQKIIKYLPEIAAAAVGLSVVSKLFGAFNPVQNVGVMNVGMMRGGGGGMGPGSGMYGGPGSRGSRGPLTKSGKPDMRYKANRNRGGTRRRFRGRGLGGLALGLGSMLGMNMLMSGGDAGDAAMMTGEDAMMMGGEVAADQVANSVANKTKPKPRKPTKPKVPKGGGGGFFKSVGNFFGGAKDFVVGGAKKIYGAGKSAVNFVGDLAGSAKKWLGGKIKGIFPKMLKIIKKPVKGVLTKIPFVGALLEMLFTGMDVNAIAKSKDMSPQEIYSEAGRSIISGGLGLTMGSLAAAAVSSLQAVGIPGWLLSGAAYMGGDFLGRLLGDAISDHVGGPAIGKAVLDLFGADVGSKPKEMATGGIVTSATNAIVGEAGAEAVVPLNEFYAKLDELIIAVKAGGDVYLDGAKVGKQLALSTSKIG
jgi:hypothetical protein